MNPSRIATALSILCISALLSTSVFATTAVPTRIVNADTAQFVGGLLVANTASAAAASVKQELVDLIVPFSDIGACNDFVTDFPNWKLDGAAPQVQFISKNPAVINYLKDSWSTSGYLGLIGKCVEK